jgi:hypothetical protein
MTYIDHLVSQYKGKGIVVDTSLLLLFFVGNYDVNQITKFKRTETFSEKDYQILSFFLQHFKVITTPNILTEITDLSDGLNTVTAFTFFPSIYPLMKQIEENYRQSFEMMGGPVFNKLGLSDAAIYSLSELGYLVLTDDLELYGYIISNGNYAINLNHIRTEYLAN